MLELRLKGKTVLLEDSRLKFDEKMEEYFMELGKNLEEERESYHFTQKEVADILHVSRQTVSNWERDVSYPDLESLVYLSDLYHISVDQLLKHAM